MPVFAEVITPGNVPLSDEEFRAVCDKYKSVESIVTALESGER
jgi:hypothetical protein